MGIFPAVTSENLAKWTTEKPVRPNKETVKGLPAHAQFPKISANRHITAPVMPIG